MTFLKQIVCVLCVLLVGVLLIATPAFASELQQTVGPARSAVIRSVPGRTITRLSEQESRNLDLLPVPFEPMAGLIVGVYWDCSNVFEDDCELAIVACTPEQETCVRA